MMPLDRFDPLSIVGSVGEEYNAGGGLGFVERDFLGVSGLRRSQKRSTLFPRKPSLY